jgi:uncharacterized protein
MEMITRSWTMDKSAVTRAEDNEQVTFDGHAAVFDQVTMIGSKRFGFLEDVAPGAFDDVLDNDVRMLINHTGLPLARTINGTLRLSQDNIGLFNSADFAPTSEARDLAILLERGDVNQQSFAFTIAEETWGTRKYEDMEMDYRTVTKVDRLFDTSIVTYPAYEGATGGLRTLDMSDDEITAILRTVKDERQALADLDAEKVAGVDSLLRANEWMKRKSLFVPSLKG